MRIPSEDLYGVMHRYRSLFPKNLALHILAKPGFYFPISFIYIYPAYS